MEFNSVEFLCIFLPLCIIGLAISPRKAGGFLILFSSIFYTWNSLLGFLILLLSIIVVHYLREELNRNILMKICISILLISPFLFFRSSIFLEGLFPILSEIQKTYPESLILPAGVSFYTFQLLGYFWDNQPSRKDVKLQESALFALFFPQLIAGPIERANKLIPQLRELFKKGVSFKYHSIKHSIYLISVGIFLKTFFADVQGHVVINTFYQKGSLAAIVQILSDGSVIYFDFLGYSLIAIGLASLFGIELTLNFQRPYSSINVKEFWRRWHITLTEWFKDYLYKPIARRFNFSRIGIIISTIIVFISTALWHGFGNRFLIWGVCHLILVFLSRIFEPTLNNQMSKIFSWIFSFISVNILWVFFFYPLPICSEILGSLFSDTLFSSLNFKDIAKIIIVLFTVIVGLLLDPETIVMIDKKILTSDKKQQKFDSKSVILSQTSKRISKLIRSLTLNYPFIIMIFLGSVAFLSYAKTFVYFRF